MRNHKLTATLSLLAHLDEPSEFIECPAPADFFVGKSGAGRQLVVYAEHIRAAVPARMACVRLTQKIKGHPPL